MSHVITEPCVGVKDTACTDVCPVDCIYGADKDWLQLYIHPNECIDCGLCVDACPVEAIFPEEEVPDQWKTFIARANARFNHDAGRPAAALTMVAQEQPVNSTRNDSPASNFLSRTVDPEIEKERKEDEYYRRTLWRPRSDFSRWIDGPEDWLTSDVQLKSQDEWDVFISHASEDKHFVKALATALREAGLRVWYDDFVLEPGDSLRRSIDRGLANSAFGIVVLSTHFFRKEWPKKELDALVTLEAFSNKVIIPIWHNVSINEVRRFSPMLADRVALFSGATSAEIESETREVLFKASPIHLHSLVSKILGVTRRDAPGAQGEVQSETLNVGGGLELVCLGIIERSSLVICLAKHPVTNSQYKKFVNHSGREMPIGERFDGTQWVGPFIPWDDPAFNHPDKPVVCVSYLDAIEYCSWLNSDAGLAQLEISARFLLPSTTLWDFAAAFQVRFGRVGSRYRLPDETTVHHKKTSPAQIDLEGSRSARNRASDLFGNVWEWCGAHHWDFPSIGNPGRGQVEIRGGGFLDDITHTVLDIRESQLRDGLKTRHFDLGFRTAAVMTFEETPPHVLGRLLARKLNLPSVVARSVEYQLEYRRWL